MEDSRDMNGMIIYDYGTYPPVSSNVAGGKIPYKNWKF